MAKTNSMTTTPPITATNNNPAVVMTGISDGLITCSAITRRRESPLPMAVRTWSSSRVDRIEVRVNRVMMPTSEADIATTGRNRWRAHSYRPLDNGSYPNDGN